MRESSDARPGQSSRVGRVRRGRAGGANNGQGPGDPRPASGDLPPELVREIERGGYYPALVTDLVALSLADEVVMDHFVHLETTFDTDEVRRHVTVMVLTPTRLLVAHVDDHHGDAVVEAGAPRPSTSTPPVAASSVESVPLHQVGSVVVSHRVVDPARYRSGQAPAELVLGLSWGTLRRVDLEPAGCGDPDCEADHGYTGTVAGEDVSLRVSADAEGADAVRAAVRFARSLTEVTRPLSGGAPVAVAVRGGRVDEASAAAGADEE